MQPVDQKSSGMLCVYQKECAISNSKKIVTTSFGPCHVLVGHDPKTKYTFLAHIDDCTHVQDVHNIFSTLRGLGVDVNNLTGIRLLGGHKTHEESNKWAHKIIDVLGKEGLGGKVDYTYFQKKLEPSDRIPVSDKTHFWGGQVDPQTGAFSFFSKVWMKLENEQNMKNNMIVADLFVESKINPAGMSSRAISELACQLAMTKEFPLKIIVG